MTGIRTLNWDLFLPSFREDVEDWLACLSCNDPLDERAPLKAPAKGTVTSKRQQTRMFASAVVLGGTPVTELKSMADLVTLKNFKVGLRYLRDPANDHGKNQPAALAICMGASGFILIPAPPWATPSPCWSSTRYWGWTTPPGPHGSAIVPSLP